MRWALISLLGFVLFNLLLHAGVFALRIRLFAMLDWRPMGGVGRGGTLCRSSGKCTSCQLRKLPIRKHGRTGRPLCPLLCAERSA